MRDGVGAGSDDDRVRWMAFASLPGSGPVRFRSERDRGIASTSALERASGGSGEAALALARGRLTRATELGAEVLLYGDAGYPEKLHDLEDPPAVLYARGDLSLLQRPAVAVVGTRDATRYGLFAARELAGTAARAGAVIVSGLARGIDGAAHLAALEAAGSTLAVLGTGLGASYPRQHARLQEEIARRGLLLTELPPDDPANAGSFPRRNRIIAALASVTVVVQAPHRSGALGTASHALDLGRCVAGVPGPIDIVQSSGVNQLLRDGAQVIATPDDLLQLLGLTPAARTTVPDLEGSEAVVWAALAAPAADLEALVGATCLPARACLGAVTALELAGLVACDLTGEIRRR